MKKRLLLIVILFAVGAITSQAQTRALKKQIVNKLIAEGLTTQQDVNECGGFSKIVDITNADLNKDHKPEFIVGFTCHLAAIYVMRKTANGIDIIYHGSQREDITPLKTYTNGWRNLRLDMYSAGTGDSGSKTLRWNGSVYK